MAGNVLNDLESFVPQIRDLAGELNGVTKALGSVGSNARAAAGKMRDLYDPTNFGGGFEKLALDAKSFNQQLEKLGHAQTFRNFKDQMDNVKEGFKQMQQVGLQQMGILGKGFESTFKRMEATNKGFWRSFGKEIAISIKGALSEILSFRNIFTVAMSVITASLNIVYKTINYFIDACKKGWEITVNWMNNLYAAAGGVAQSLGLSSQSVGKLRGQIESLYIAESNLAESMGDLANAASAVMTAFREQSPATALIDDIFLMGKAMGMTNESAAKMIFYFDKAWGVKGSKERRAFVGEQLDFANKIGVPHKEMMETIAQQLDLTSRLGRDGVVAIHRLTAASKAFGISQEKIVSSMAKFDTLEETIPTINKINLLTGAAIDPFLVFAEKDPAKKFVYMMENIRRSVGDWKDVDRLTKSSLANIIDFSEHEMEIAFEAGNMQTAVDDLMKKGIADKKTTEAWNDTVKAAKSFFVDFSRPFRPLFSQISKIFMGLAPSLVTALKNVLTGFSSLLRSVTGKDKGLNLLLYGKEEQGGGFAHAIKKWSEGLKRLLQSGTFQDRVLTFVNNMRDTFLKAVEFINKLIDKIKDRLPDLMDKFNAFFKMVVGRVEEVLSKIEKYNVLGTVESVAKTLFKLIKFIDQNKVMLLGVLGAFKLTQAIGGFQQAYGSVYGLRNVAATNMIGKGGFANKAAAQSALLGMGLNPDMFTFGGTRKGDPARTAHIRGFNSSYRASWGERAYIASQKPARIGGLTGASRMGAGLGGLMTAGVLGAQIYGMATQKERVSGSQIGAAVGGAALGAVGAFFGGPVGAMIGGIIGNTAGKWIGNKLDKTAQILEKQAKVSEGLDKNLEKIAISKLESEKKLNESLNKFSIGLEKAKVSINKLSSASDILQQSWRSRKDGSGEIRMELSDYNELLPNLPDLLDAGLIDEYEFKKLSDPSGPVAMTNERFKNLIANIDKYNTLEAIRIRLMEKNPEIAEELKKRKSKAAYAELNRTELKNLSDALTSWNRSRGMFQPKLYKGTSGLMRSKATLELFDKDFNLGKELLTGDFRKKGAVEAFFAQKGMETPQEDVLNDIANMNQSIYNQQQLIDMGINTTMEGVSEAMNKHSEIMEDTNEVIANFPKDQQALYVAGMKDASEHFQKLIQDGKEKEMKKFNVVQEGMNKILTTGAIKDIIKGDSDLAASFARSMGSQQDMISFFSSLKNNPKIILSPEENSAISRMIEDWNKPVEQFADGGAIRTNTVLSTVTASGRLRPYATAGEPGNSESVVPDRKLARTVNLNLTIPLTIDGKKITDVVIQRLIPLDA